MTHEPGHIDFNTMDETPQVKIQPTDKQMEDALGDGGGSDVIEGAVYDYPNTEAIPFSDLLAKEIGNLDFESGQFWGGKEIREYKDYEGIFNNTKPIGFDNRIGGKPIYIHEAIGENASNAEKLEYIYNTVTYNRDTVSETKDVDLKTNLLIRICMAPAEIQGLQSAQIRGRMYK